jgi:hypothetical protein
VLEASISNTDHFLLRNKCVSTFRSIDLFGRKWTSLHLESSDLQDIFISKINSFLTMKQCGNALASNIDVFCGENNVLLQLSKIQNKPFFILKMMISRSILFKN